jgi:hypothetical protein
MVELLLIIMKSNTIIFLLIRPTRVGGRTTCFILLVNGGWLDHLVNFFFFNIYFIFIFSSFLFFIVSDTLQYSVSSLFIWANLIIFPRDLK